MQLKTSRYGVMLLVQFGLLLVDIFVNCFSDFARNTSVVVLLLFIIQDVCLIFALISLVLSFFSTYAFQAGLIELLYDRFRVTVIISAIYLIFTIALHSWSLSERWGHPLEHIWPDGLIWLCVTQRLCEWHLPCEEKMMRLMLRESVHIIMTFLSLAVAVLYYHHYKRSVLRISDPRFYEDFNWRRGFVRGLVKNVDVTKCWVPTTGQLKNSSQNNVMLQNLYWKESFYVFVCYFL
ncbi:hypothetical protein Cfor_12232 [Coptotermes formosanus]|uniref:Transmembrane protein 138 n=1 Tax=Coptotermes formosanus TaxID=36987 RepID=A0A6L2Q8E4_COPFO|nr:hypothetical protein Cfor_12232 [Coptotermes formosanus]